MAGLTFDCHGLAPAPAEPVRAAGSALFGLGSAPQGEVVSIGPGPHLADAPGLLPVVRMLAALGTALARLPGLLAFGWEPAQSWIEPAYFIRVVGDWLAGGAFPALGLTGLKRESSGAMVSHGLAFLIGQELRLEPDPGSAPAELAIIAVRLIHELVEHGPVRDAQEFAGPGGEVLLAVPVRNGAQLRVKVRR